MYCMLKILHVRNGTGNTAVGGVITQTGSHCLPRSYPGDVLLKSPGNGFEKIPLVAS